MSRYYTRVCNFYYGSKSKALIPNETLTGEEIENIINKNIYPADKQDLKVEDDKGSAMGALGLKPKIVH